MSKQTATEWLFAHLLPFLEFSDPKEREHFRKCLAEAKEMDKEQMIQFTNNYLRQIYEVGEMTIEDFYNETYGGDK